MDFKEDYQQKEDVVSVNQEQQTQQNSYVEDQSQQGIDEAAWAAKIHDGEQEAHHHHGMERRDRTSPNNRDLSARLRGDNELTSIFEGVGTVKKGDRGMDVTKLQQVLVDMKYQLPVYGVDGKFEDETLAALELFQADEGLTVSGELDSDTIQAMDARFDERTDYITAAEDFEEEAPREGTRALSEEDQTAALTSLNPLSNAEGATFDVQKADDYSNAIRDQLADVIAEFHQDLYADLAPLRADPETNFHEDGDIEGAANAGKDVTDQLYGNLNTGPAFQMNVNLIDQWKDQEDRQELLNDTQKKMQAVALVKYLIDANCDEIHPEYNADPYGTEESKALRPIIESFVDSEEKIQTLLDIDTGWKGVQQDGIQYLQRYKDPNNEANREKMWELFHVSIHEYIHTLANSEYKRWAYGLGGSETHTLIEGFCEFFTLNVRAKFPTSALASFQQQVEGSFYDANTPQAIPEVESLDVGLYRSNAEAERMVGIIGIKNAQLGYFQGAVDLMGR